MLRNAVKSPRLCPGGGRNWEAARSTCLFYLAVNFHALDCLEFCKKGTQIAAERSISMFRQHARHRTTATVPKSGHNLNDGLLRCCGWGVMTWKFTEPVYESRGLWCNREACCVLWACPFDVRGVNTCRVSSWSVCTVPRVQFSLENFSTAEWKHLPQAGTICN